MASIFANLKCTEEWLEASSRTITSDPRHKPALDVHVALHEISDLYSPEKQPSDPKVLPINKRHEIFARFERSALTGYPVAMFFEGLARREGFGCKQDVIAGNALIQVAGLARNCDLALNFLGVSYFSQAPETAVKFFQQAALNGYNRAYKNLGLANLYGVGIRQSYVEAIRCFKTAGDIAKLELAKVAYHLACLQQSLQKTNVLILDQTTRTAPRPQMVM